MPSHLGGQTPTWRSGGLRGHPAELTTGHVQHLAVDVVRPGRAEEEDGPGGFLGAGRTPQWDDHRRHLAQLLGDAQLDLLAVLASTARLFLRRRQTRLDEAE